MLGWSWKLGRLAGIDVYVHVTFLLLVGWVFVSSIAQGDTLAGAVTGVLFVLAIFVCIVLHELGHALAARRYGIQTRNITLLPIGGVANLARMPERPLHELVVAIAGPLVNVVIVAVLMSWLWLYGALVPMSSLDVMTGSFIGRLIGVNVYLVLFNLIPAFPMDGGRIMRAFLAMKLPYHRATDIAAKIGQTLAFALGLLGLFGPPMLLVIAFFVFLGAQQENAFVQLRSALTNVPVSAAMITDFRALSPDDPLARAVELVLAGFQEDFPVVSGGSVVGVLTRGDLVTAIAERGSSEPVAAAMRKDFETVSTVDSLSVVFSKLQSTPCQTIPVFHKGVFVGIVTAHNVSEFLMIRSALSGAAAGPARV